MSQGTKQPHGAKAKKLNRLAKKAKTNKSQQHRLIHKMRRIAAQKRFINYMWFFKHGKKEEENAN